MLCWVSVGQSKQIRPGEWGNSTHVQRMRHGLLGTSEFSTHRSVSTCDSLSQTTGSLEAPGRCHFEILIDM